MVAKFIASLVALAVLIVVSNEARARTCRIVECEQVRAGEICVSRPCQVACLCASVRFNMMHTETVDIHTSRQ